MNYKSNIIILDKFNKKFCINIRKMMKINNMHNYYKNMLQEKKIISNKTQYGEQHQLQCCASFERCKIPCIIKN